MRYVDHYRRHDVGSECFMLFYCCWLGDGRQWYTSAVHLAGLPSHLARLDVHLAGLSAPCTPGRQSTWQGLIYTCRASCTPGRSSYTPGRAWRTPGRAVHLAGLPDVRRTGGGCVCCRSRITRRTQPHLPGQGASTPIYTISK